MATTRAGSRRQVRQRTPGITYYLRAFAERITSGGAAERKAGIRRPNAVNDCIFCKHDDDSINRIMCENDVFFARYDNYPSNPGHVEIVPKRHAESFFDLTEDEVLEAYRLILEAKSRLMDEFDPPHGYTIGVNEGTAAGRSIDHLHIHLIPRYNGDVKDPRGGIRQATPNWDPDSWK